MRRYKGQPAEKCEPTSSYRKILELALPVGLETVAQTSFGVVDQVIVGLLGADAVAGVGLSNSVTFIVMLVYSAIGIGSGVLVAQAFGRQNMEEVSATAALGQIVAGVFGICTALPLALFPRVILHWIGAQESVANDAAGYFQLFAASAPFTVISAVSTATFRSLNDTRTPMIITMGAVALNTLLGFPFSAWDRPISEARSAGRRRCHIVVASCPLPHSTAQALSSKRRAEMAMALAMVRNENHLTTALRSHLSACSE